MTNVAVIVDGKVANIAQFENADDVEGFPFEDANGTGAYGVILQDGQAADIGWLYENSVFTAPPLTAEQQEAIEAAAIAANVSLKSTLMDEASEMVSVLQDAVDLDMATDAETTALPLWKTYRVTLNRIDANTANNIDWPEKPA